MRSRATIERAASEGTAALAFWRITLSRIAANPEANSKRFNPATVPQFRAPFAHQIQSASSGKHSIFRLKDLLKTADRRRFRKAARG